MTPTSDYFSQGSFGFSMQMQRGKPEEFFRGTGQRDEILRERSMWIGRTPGRCVLVNGDADGLVREAAQLAANWRTAPAIESDDPGEACVQLGRSWEPDFLLLSRGADRRAVFRAGSVCFPSSWPPEEKLGLPIDEIHSVVPGLNAALGKRISGFLERLRPGVAWLRSNWGLSRSEERNQHPSRNLPRLDAQTGLKEVWLRVERQALVALPESGGVLFGIRIETVPLAKIAQDVLARHRLLCQLKTMPDDMAAYKNIQAVREPLIRELEDIES